MHYKVTATFKTETATEFPRKLTDGTIENQKPDGKEIIQSMTTRARIDEDGNVGWSEACYCDTPLQHERETVYDKFFTALETEEVDDYVSVDEGELFIEFLKREAE